MRGLVRTLAVLSAVLLAPVVASAQQASISGVIKDASGAVLPGVSVEATSPALTEKVRSVVSDGTGQYRIVELPPGTYAVTFSLPGFNLVKREGVVLTGALTANIDVELRVGSLEETVTVTGESPIVDVQSARRQQIIDGDVLQTIPTSRSYNNVLQLVPGVVAGDGQVQLRPTMLLFTAHGGSTEDGRLTLDGINTGASRGGAGVSGYIPDMQNAAEVTFTISGNLGEAETGGPQMTVVPRSGSNTFNGSFFISGLNDSMQGDNFDAQQLSVLAVLLQSRFCSVTTRFPSVDRSCRTGCGSSSIIGASMRPMPSPASSQTRTLAIPPSGPMCRTSLNRAESIRAARSTPCD